MAEATRWGKDSVIIRYRLEKLPPNPEIDRPGRERASVRNLPHPSSPPARISFFLQSLEKKGVDVCVRQREACVYSMVVGLLSSRDLPPRQRGRIMKIMYRYCNKGMIGYVDADIFIGNP